MANTKSAEKAARQSTVHRARNDALTSQLRSAIRKATLALKAGKQEEATAALAHATPIIDSMVNKGIIHRNKAARHKSRLDQAGSRARQVIRALANERAQSSSQVKPRAIGASDAVSSPAADPGLRG